MLLDCHEAFLAEIKNSSIMNMIKKISLYYFLTAKKRRIKEKEASSSILVSCVEPLFCIHDCPYPGMDPAPNVD